MKKLLSASIAAATLASAGIAVPAAAEVSANAGFVSDYYFRGVNLGDAGAYAGLDYSESGFYAGVWTIDDGASSYDIGDDSTYNGNDGQEVDYYLGYGMEHGDFSWSLGLTHYDYTYTSSYEREFNLNLGYKGFGLEYSSGSHTEDPDGADEDSDYTFIGLSWSGEIYGVTYGNWASDEDGDDSEYSYAEVSASGEVSGLDMGITIGRTFDVKDSNGDDDEAGDGYIVLDISKGFTL